MRADSFCQHNTAHKIVYNRFDEAMKLLNETERISRDIGDPICLSASIGGQAYILRERGDLDGALKLLKEMEHISREIDHVQHLAECFRDQSKIMVEQVRFEEGLSFAEEAYRLATEYGFATLAGEIGQIIDYIPSKLVEQKRTE